MHWRFWRPALYGHTISDDVGQASLQTVLPNSITYIIIPDLIFSGVATYPSQPGGMLRCTSSCDSIESRKGGIHLIVDSNLTKCFHFSMHTNRVIFSLRSHLFSIPNYFHLIISPFPIQILEAREELLQSLQAKNKRGSETTGESSENANESSGPAEEKVIEPSIIQDKEVSISEVRSFEEPTSDITPEIEAEKFPVSTTEVEIIDKSVIEEELLSVKDKIKAPLVESRLHTDTDEDEVDEWPEDDSAEEPEAVAAASNRASLGREEDVSFSDLEDDDDDDGNKGSGK
uniref:Uncharacterized protein n=1 Tax=Aegilops tauschii subsp. strangulata TaxID=200361 RepID=A0A452ZJB5_AEGTS